MARDMSKTPLILRPFSNGGWAILEDSGPSTMLRPQEVAAFTNPVDLIEWLAENLIPDPPIEDAR